MNDPRPEGHMASYIGRRKFLATLGGAAAAWPLAARAQQPKVRRIGVLMNTVSDDAEGQARLAAFHQGLQQLGWTVGHNVQIDYRWGGDDAEEIAPRVTRVAVLRDLTIGISQLAAIQAVAPALGVELTPIGIRDAVEVERGVTAFARGSTDGMIVTPSTLALAHRELIATVAARHRLPAVYGFRYYVTVGGLLSYGPNTVDQFRRAAGYVDRILKGEKPADFPVQTPTKYELVINLKTAKALGLDLPASVLSRADEVIE